MAYTNLERQKATRRAYRQGRKARRLCRDCSNPVLGKASCAVCLERAEDKDKAARHLLRDEIAHLFYGIDISMRRNGSAPQARSRGLQWARTVREW